MASQSFDVCSSTVHGLKIVNRVPGSVTIGLVG